jgi:phosphopantothenoylcysteine decarboxylase/phosphopantothenate--cysteine ligase
MNDQSKLDSPQLHHHDPLRGRRIALGVTGSIAAYKALTLASRLTQAGSMVDVLLTRSATELVRPLAFQALTHRPVITSLFEPVGDTALDHIAVARSVDALVVAPATADVIARLALGRADDALTTTALACQAQMFLAPAMEPRMWSHPATQEHVALLRSRGVKMIGPDTGRMASGEKGLGRMVEPNRVLEALRVAFARDGDLAGRTVVVTAGPTHEALDPVRFIGNRSSGKMGLAVAQAARDRGAAVKLITGPICLGDLEGVETRRVTTASEMLDAVLELAASADALVMAAAVADYRPLEPQRRKIKKASDNIDITLERNPDVLMELDRALADASSRPYRVGFAAETGDLEANARAKLLRKGLDLIVANRVPDTFGSERVSALLIDAAATNALEPMKKSELAHVILDRVSAVVSVEQRPGS